jgi:sulfite exporter TauE/SafE
MTQALIISGFLLGLAGSVHCLGMCGPLSWALPIRQENSTTQVVWLIHYQVGRVMSYGVLGLMAGSIGSIFRITGVQQLLTIAFGAMILFFGMTSLSPNWSSRFKPIRWLHDRIQRTVQRQWKNPMSGGRMFLLGALNGLLPCGMVYLAILTAATLDQMLDGSLFMIFFGIGTVPAMMLSSMAGLWVGKEIRLKLRRAIPVMVGVVGLMLILRGLDLGIPYLSPEIPTKTNSESSIHCTTARMAK